MTSYPQVEGADGVVHQEGVQIEPRILSPALAQAVLQTEQPTLTPDLPRDIACFRLLLPKGTLFSEEGPEIRSVVVADVRAMEGWLPDHFALAGGGLACVGLGEDGCLASSPLAVWRQTSWPVRVVAGLAVVACDNVGPAIGKLVLRGSKAFGVTGFL